LVLGLASLAVVQPDTLVATDTDQGSTVRTECGSIDELVAGVVGADLSHAVSAVGCDAVAEALFTVSHSDDALRISVPSDVIDSASNDMIFSLGCALTLAIPHTHGTGHITTGYVEATGGETSDSGLRDMFGVLSCNTWVVDVADEDGLVGGAAQIPSVGFFVGCLASEERVCDCEPQETRRLGQGRLSNLETCLATHSVGTIIIAEWQKQALQSSCTSMARTPGAASSTTTAAAAIDVKL
ncbi:tricorn protease domain 2-containing protein, partial [Aureobasidium melanogenum]